ncbi:MAG: RNA-binding domain-containing protein [Archaeoglobaceae archaeon]
MNVERITASAVVYSTESEEKVLQAFKNLFPFEPQVEVMNVQGHYGNPMQFLKTEVTKKKEIKELWNFLMKKLAEQKNALLNTIDEKLDENNVFHIRLSKQKAYYGQLEITEGGDNIKLKAKIVSYPARREKALKTVEELLSQA